MKQSREYETEFPTPKLDDASLDNLEARITEVCGHINAATFRFLELVAEFDRTQGWARHGLANCAQWLNWQCGIGACAAREKVRVARALESLPKIGDAFREGQVSYSKVRAMTRVATEENEATLLNIALHGTASHVERTVRKFRWVKREMERYRAEHAHQSRYVRCWHDDDGSWCMHARLAPEVGALVAQAIEVAMAAEQEPEHGTAGMGESAAGAKNPVEQATAVSAETNQASDGAKAVSAETNGASGNDQPISAESPQDRVPNSSAVVYMIDDTGHQYAAFAETQEARNRELPVSAETNHIEDAVSAEMVDDPPSPGACRADGLRHMAEQFLAHRAKAAGVGSDRYQVVVHIAQEALREESTASSEDSPARAAGSGAMQGGAELESGRELSVETARRLGCGGSLVGLVEDDDGEPLSIGRKTRAIPPAIQRALRSRDRGCRFPGCDRTRFTHAHHIRHWADGGETSLGNLVTLCHHHHHLVHEGGYGVRKVDGKIEFTTPRGRPIAPGGRRELWRRWRFRGNSAGDPTMDSGDVPLAAYNRRHGVTVDSETARSGWRGERMDYGLTMERLCWDSGLGL